MRGGGQKSQRRARERWSRVTKSRIGASGAGGRAAPSPPLKGSGLAFKDPRGAKAIPKRDDTGSY
jgi:hypothetical protein